MMAKKKLQAEEADELFVHRTDRISETKKINIEIHHLSEKIADVKNFKYKLIKTPCFTVAGLECCISIFPQFDEEIVIELLGPYSDPEDAKWVEGWMTVEPGHKLSHEWYRRFAKENGDVLKLEATVTMINLDPKGDDWKRSKPKLELPKSLRSEETIPRVNRAIMNDVETADFSMRCANKTFRVHKSFLCSRSSVLRAMILADMEEGRKGEVFIPDIDEDTISAMITFIYTGEVDIGEGLDVEMVARAADKYDLPGFLDIFCFKVKKEDISNETVADLLITANRYESEELKKIAKLKLRANKKDIVSDDGFRAKMMKADPSILLDLMKDF